MKGWIALGLVLFSVVAVWSEPAVARQTYATVYGWLVQHVPEPPVKRLVPLGQPIYR